MQGQKNIVLGVTASIAIYKACDLVRRLQDEKFSVTCVMTDEARELINPVVFQSLTGNRVYSRMFNEPDAWEIGHISLASKADIVIIAPATANVIGKMACGICDDLLTCTVCATTAPVVVCPAMNDNMYKNKVVRDNIARLRSLGYKIVEPASGKLACGSIGVGCLADVAHIVAQVKKILK